MHSQWWIDMMWIFTLMTYDTGIHSALIFVIFRFDENSDHQLPIADEDDLVPIRLSVHFLENEIQWINLQSKLGCICYDINTISTVFQVRLDINLKKKMQLKLLWVNILYFDSYGKLIRNFLSWFTIQLIKSL